MSVKHTSWVWDHSRAEGGTLLVALTLADSVNALNGDNECWPRQDFIAKRVRLSERQVIRCLQELEELGEIEKRRTQNGNRYRFLMLATPDDALSHSRGSCSDPTCCRNDTGVTPSGTPASDGEVTPASDPCVEPEVEPEGNQNDRAQGALLPDPIDEVWALYMSLGLRKRQRPPLRKERDWISKAIKACGIDQVKEAVRGLAASEHHRQGGWTGIEYAVRPKASETVESRIEMMAAKAPAQRSDGHPPIAELLRGFTGYNRELVIGKMRDVQRGVLEPSAQNEQIATEAERWLRETARIVVVERNGRKFVWGKAT